MRNRHLLVYIFLFTLLSTPFWGARLLSSSAIFAPVGISQDSLPPIKTDSLPTLKPTIQLDSLTIKPSTRPLQQPTDSLSADSIRPKRKPVLEAEVDYNSNDSTVITGNNIAYLYGKAAINYMSIDLKAEAITIAMDSSVIGATYGLDSLGAEFGHPVFNNNGSAYESKTMRYNFKTKKAFTTNLITQQGEGYVIAGQAKKMPDDAIYMQNGQYTTCDNPEHPHFFWNLTKAKVRPNKNVVTGPAYLVIEDLPIPFIGLPFAFFPFSKSYSSGVIMPSYGDDLDKGFNLHDGGYYFAINNYIDLALTGEIYTKGSWGLNARSNYKKIYKYSGSFDLGYLYSKTGDKGLPDYSVAKNSKINWTHTQDAKANMFRTLSASVNFATSTFDRQSINGQMNPNIYTQNTKSSSINMSQRFPDSPWSLSASASAAQSSRDSSISLTLPNFTIAMSRIQPFKRKNAIGAEKWYEKIQFSYTGDFRNSINTKENLLLKSNLQKDWKNGMKHNIPVSATFNIFDNLNVTPSFNYTERWYTDKIYKGWNENGTSFVPTDTVYGFNRIYDFNTAVSLQTKVYGFFTPLFSKSTTIRHIFSPSITFSYAPDFSAPSFGFYEEASYYNNATNEQVKMRYSPYASGMFGAPGAGKQGNITFNFQNNVEMKVKSDNDSIGNKKISLIDNLGISFSHNLMADSLKWSDISTNIRLKLTKSLTVNLNATWDPYTYNEKGVKVNQLRIKRYGTLARLRGTNYSISPSINQDTFKKWFGGGGDEKDKKDKKDKKTETDANTSATDDTASGEESTKSSMFSKKQDTGEYDADGYIQNSIKWNLGLNLSMSYGYAKFNPAKKEYDMLFTKNFGFSGSIQPTLKWNLTFDASYDFEASKLAYVNCSVSRDLHCWTLSGSFTPVGPYKTYFISLRASSSMLQDLKYEKRGRSSSYDPNWD